MRKLLFIFAMLTGAAHSTAQNEVTADSIPLPYANNIRMSGEFMLDMNLLIPPKLPSFSVNTDLFYSPAFLLQAATFKPNNMRLSTYGQYTWDGKRIPRPSVLPWEKNNFMGGMELKVNKNFGIRIEVQQGRNPVYPH